jgi:hypothetical protein
MTNADLALVQFALTSISHFPGHYTLVAMTVAPGRHLLGMMSGVRARD